MSASPIARQMTQSQSIPSRRILLDDPSQLPVDYSTTPGGTFYSTTPGGTRLVYERSALMELRNSPLSRTPPSLNIPMPDLMNKDIKNPPKIRPTKKQPERPKNGNIKAPAPEESHEQFEIDI